jgi:hypothetical protein
MSTIWRPSRLSRDPSDENALAALEAELEVARREIDQWPTRDLRELISTEVSAQAEVTRSRARQVRRGVALALAAALVISGAAAAAFGLPHVLFHRNAAPGVPIGDHPIGSGWTFDREVTVDEAIELSYGSLVWPFMLGRPDHAYVQMIGSAQLLTVTYDARPDYPAGGSNGPGVLLMQLRGRLEELRVDKELPNDGTLELLDVDGVPAAWVAGRFHQFSIDANNGEHVTQQFAGETLVWEFQGRVFRLETRAGTAATLSLARQIQAELRRR